MTLTFHPLTLSDREAMRAVTLHTGRRNCNYTFANLIGWRFWFDTEVCVLENAVVLRYSFGGKRAYMVSTAEDLSPELLDALLVCSQGKLTLIGLEDSQVAQLLNIDARYAIAVEPERDRYDYLYRRDSLATLHGGHLNAKRNHINRFRANHPDFEYRPLTPELFDECRRLTAIWQEEKAESETIAAEHQAMETVFAHWADLDMLGGSIFADGRMVAFTYGAAVTTDTFDVCVEKADRRVEGAFAIINQQFAGHLPERFFFVNREEDMGIPGLRKAKLSYHPEMLLSYNVLHIA